MIKILIISLVLSLSLFARLNPFEVDNTAIATTSETNQTITQKLEPIKVINPLKTKDDGSRTVKVEGTNTKNVLIKKVTKIKPVISKSIVKEKILKEKPTKEEITALCKVQPKTPMVKVIKKELINPNLVKEKTTIIKHHKMSRNDEFVPTTYKILPFITIDTDFNDLKISSRNKYTIVTYHVLKEKNKVAFDFLAKVWFYTRYKKLDAPHFDAYTIGNHKDKQFFRVTISLKENISNYKISINNNIATIKYKK